MSPVVDVVAGWDLADAVIDAVEPFEASRHLPVMARHRLTGVAHAAMLAGDVEVDEPERLVEAHRRAMARTLLLEDVLLDASEVLDHAGLEHRVLKGAALAHRWSRPELREFGDNDLLVRPDQLSAAAAAFEAAGAARVFSPLSSTWEQRFAKSITLRWRDTEIDLHRTLAPGPYGLTIDTDPLFATTSVIELAGVEVATLRDEHHLIHAAVHVALGDITPRLGNVRDVAVLLATPDLDADQVIATVVDWRLGAPFAAGVVAAEAIGAERTGIVEWARRYRPSTIDRRLLASYQHRQGRFRRQVLASLQILGWRDRVVYLRSLRSGRAR